MNGNIVTKLVYKKQQRTKNESFHVVHNIMQSGDILKIYICDVVYFLMETMIRLVDDMKGVVEYTCEAFQKKFQLIY